MEEIDDPSLGRCPKCGEVDYIEVPDRPGWVRCGYCTFMFEKRGLRATANPDDDDGE